MTPIMTPETVIKEDTFFFERKSFIYLLFFLSGLSALIYEVAWLNRIQLIMGHTIYALSTLLGAYLAGLAMGALGAHKLIKLKINPLFLYLIFELLIGIYGLLFFPILELINFLYSPIATNWHFSLPSLSIIQFIFCGLVVFFPTCLMGATLPLLSEHLYHSGHEASENISLLYGINTLGAFFGCLMAGYFILPTLGYNRSIYLCTFINIILFCIASTAFKDFSLPSIKKIISKLHLIFEKSGEVQPLSRADKALNVILFISGLCSIFVQLLWNRLAALNFGPSAYIFPLVTSIVLLGIFIGSIIIKKFSKNESQLTAILIITLILSTILLALGNYAFSHAPLLVVFMHQKLEMSFLQYSLLQFIWMGLCILPAGICMGAVFPAALSLFIRSKNQSSQPVGWGYFLNIMGILVGSIIGAFLVIPYWGIECLNRITIFLPLIAASLFSWSFGWKHHLWPMFLLLIPIGNKIIPPFNKQLLTSGYFYNRVSKKDPKELKKSYLSWQSYHNYKRPKLLDYRDDIHGTISIHQRWDQKAIFFKINGKIDGNNVNDTATVRSVSLFPLLFRTDYQDILTIGLGTGETANITGHYPKMKKSVVVELSPSMIEYAHKHFFIESRLVWQDSRFKIINRDGREYLQHTKEKFDLIISEPSNPWVDGVSSLFTQEYFQLISKRLKAGGVASIWFHRYGLECDAIDSVIMAVYKSFNFLKAYNRGGDIIILASNDLPLIATSLPHKLEELEKQLFELASIKPNYGGVYGDHSYKDLENTALIKDRKQLDKFDVSPIVNTDDNQFLQFKSGKSFWTSVACKVSY